MGLGMKWGVFAITSDAGEVADVTSETLRTLIVEAAAVGSSSFTGEQLRDRDPDEVISLKVVVPRAWKRSGATIPSERRPWMPSWLETDGFEVDEVCSEQPWWSTSSPSSASVAVVETAVMQLWTRAVAFMEQQLHSPVAVDGVGLILALSSPSEWRQLASVVVAMLHAKRHLVVQRGVLIKFVVVLPSNSVGSTRDESACNAERRSAVLWAKETTAILDLALERDAQPADSYVSQTMMKGRLVVDVMCSRCSGPPKGAADDDAIVTTATPQKQRSGTTTNQTRHTSAVASPLSEGSSPVAALSTSISERDVASPDIPCVGQVLSAQMSEETLIEAVEAVQRSPSRISLLNGPTGCGKSTLVPLALIRAAVQHVVWVAQPRRLAAVSLSKRVASLHGTEADVTYAIGGDGGPSSRGGSRIVYMTSGVLLMRVKAAFRDASYLRQSPVTHVVLDEVHERSVEYDLLMCLLRELLHMHPTLRVVLMSATMSAGWLQAYMARGGPSVDHVNVLTWAPTPSPQLPTPLGSRAVGCPLNDVVTFHVPLTTRPRRVHYLEDVIYRLGSSRSASEATRQRYRDADVMRALHTAPSHASGLLWESRFRCLIDWLVHLHTTVPLEESILVFVAGISTIEEVQDALEQHKDLLGASEDCSVSKPPPFCIFTAHSSVDSVSGEGSRQLFELPEQHPQGASSTVSKPPDSDRGEPSESLSSLQIVSTTPSSSHAAAVGARRIILATNIAESSVTIPDVDHVVDTCLCKEQRYLHEEGMATLEERYCSKDSCEQRAGRTGRLRFGSVWRLVLQAEYDQFDNGRTPGILQAPLTSVVLLAADSIVGDVEQLLQALPSPPPPQAVLRAIFELREHYGALVQTVSPTSGCVQLQPSLKGMLFAAMGMSVQAAHVVLLGCMFGVELPAMQCAALMSASAPLLTDEGVAFMADFDHGTACDWIGLVEMARWASRRRWPALLPADSASSRCIEKTIRKHVVEEVHKKVGELHRVLGRFGLADPFTLLSQPGSSSTSVSSAVWQASTRPLTSAELVRLLGVLSMAFCNRTFVTNDLGGKYHQAPSRNAFKGVGRADDTTCTAIAVSARPSHHVLVALRSPITHEAEDRIVDFVSPSVCSIKRVSDTKMDVDVAVERQLDPFGCLVPDAYINRVVRRFTFDAYRLLRMNRQTRRALGVAHCDTTDEVHVLSSKFTECRTPVFMDRGSILYPLVFDPSMRVPPSVVACQLVRRQTYANITTSVYLPGSLATLPIATAVAAHWDGRSIDGRKCFELPTLPHCHVSRQGLWELVTCSPDSCVSELVVNDILRINEGIRLFVPQVSGFVLGQAYAELTHTISQLDGSHAAHPQSSSSSVWLTVAQEFLRPAWAEASVRRGRLGAAFDRVMALHLDNLPAHFAPHHIQTFLAAIASTLPPSVQHEAFMQRALMFSQSQSATSTDSEAGGLGGAQLPRVLHDALTEWVRRVGGIEQRCPASAMARSATVPVESRAVLAFSTKSFVRKQQAAALRPTPHDQLISVAQLRAYRASQLKATDVTLRSTSDAIGLLFGVSLFPPSSTATASAASSLESHSTTPTCANVQSWLCRESCSWDTAALRFPRRYARAIPSEAVCVAAADVVASAVASRRANAGRTVNIVDLAPETHAGALSYRVVAMCVTRCITAVRRVTLLSASERLCDAVAQNCRVAVRHGCAVAGQLVQWRTGVNPVPWFRPISDAIADQNQPLSDGDVDVGSVVGLHYVPHHLLCGGASSAAAAATPSSDELDEEERRQLASTTALLLHGCCESGTSVMPRVQPSLEGILLVVSTDRWPMMHVFLQRSVAASVVSCTLHVSQRVDLDDALLRMPLSVLWLTVLCE